jgi:UDP-N-acetylmuramoyl-L-alanyl-D-glutamate--2,6-diaminopimelate ligase
MTLSKILAGITVSKMVNQRYGQSLVTQDMEIRRLQYDSRKVERNDVFVAIHGTSRDGNKFIMDAVERGASVVVTDEDRALPDSYFMHAGVMKVVVPDTRIALARMSSAYFGNPSLALTMVGVTGTNGKTTTTHLLKSLFEAQGKTAGLIGTIEYVLGKDRIPATHTTPESLELNEMLARMVEGGCSSAVMEVSSHALHQHRVEGIEFDSAVFTNLTQDHLDYHGSMEEYFKAKRILFDTLSPNAWAVINVDDEWGKRLYGSVAGQKISYGVDSPAIVRAKNISLSLQDLRFIVEHGSEETEIQSPLVGRFNVSNILAAFSAGISLGIPKSTMQQALQSVRGVRGRFERIVSPRGWIAVIDYAHTPDALEKAIKAARDLLGTTKNGRVVTVFGCGGNRDAKKRPMMGRIASELSDITVVTSDNPRHESADAIIDEIMVGVKPGSRVHRESDRGKAIMTGLDIMRPGDVALIAGKGHEDYQVIGDKKVHFSDREIVEEFLRAHA